ncbi:hypothetical protein [Actinomadura atramentaria]|uniref:hypothetical protein n=1 Tax=Actinomadura atramentaria TaxID=1990 RepID=UPI0003A773F5|nr:hypothetical protein [Actinomadura atramentaria]
MTLPAPTRADPPRRRGRRLVPVLSSVAAGAVTAGLVLGFGLRGGHVRDPRPSPAPSSASPLPLPGLLAAVPQACESVRAVAERLVPDAGFSQRGTDLKRAAPIGGCTWETSSTARTGLVQRSRALDVGFHLWPAEDAASSAFADDRDVLRGRAGARRKSGADALAYGPADDVSGVGSGAVRQYWTRSGAADGTEQLSVRYRNLVATVRFSGRDAEAGRADGPDPDPTPLAEAEARDGADRIARALVAFLDGCADCR